MKLIDYIIFPFAVAFFAIGVYESIVLGIGQAYWLFMVSLALLFLFNYRKSKRERK